MMTPNGKEKNTTTTKKRQPGREKQLPEPTRLSGINTLNQTGEVAAQI